VVATPVPEARPGTVAITFGAPRFIADQLREVVRAFNQADPSIVVAVEVRDRPDVPGSMADAARSSDCFAWPEAPREDEFAALLDLQPLIDADATFPRDDYLPPLLAPFQQGGGQYGLPFTVFFRALHYNVAVFDAAGLAHPSAAWTLDDFLGVAQQLTRGAGRDKQYGFGAYGAQTGEVFFFLDRLEVAPTLGDGATLQPRFTDPQVAHAIHRYLELLRTSSPDTRLKGYRRNDLRDETSPLIAAGRIGMWLAFGGAFLDRGPDARPGFAWAMAPPPLGTSAVTANDVRVHGLYIAAQTERVEACWIWLKYLSGDLSSMAGGFPARISLAESDAFRTQAPLGALDVYDAYRAAFARRASTGSRTAPFSRSAIDYYWLFRAVERALQGGDLERELAEAQTLTELYLACVRGGVLGSTCAIQVDPDYQGFAAPIPTP
jgi:ABC-type glycerol-3-phosphate transport system substrate-binding protein